MKQLKLWNDLMGPVFGVKPKRRERGEPRVIKVYQVRDAHGVNGLESNYLGVAWDSYWSLVGRPRLRSEAKQIARNRDATVYLNGGASRRQIVKH